MSDFRPRNPNRRYRAQACAQATPSPARSWQMLFPLSEETDSLRPTSLVSGHLLSLINADCMVCVVYNLTSWGYQDCFSEKNDGAYGGVLSKLLYRTLPNSYASRSAYARFPFMVPKTMEGYLENLVDSPVKEYTFRRPAPALPVYVASDYSSVKLILERNKDFVGRSREKLEALSGLSIQHPVFFTVSSCNKFLFFEGLLTLNTD